MISSKDKCGISNGSACTSNSYSPSYVLKAMGLSDYEAECSIRISWGPDSPLEDVVSGIEDLIQNALLLKN